MKKTFLLFLITLLSVFVQAQERRYVILDSVYNPDLNYSHVVSEYHGYPIESFNVFLDKEKSTIALLSVLKPFGNQLIQWDRIDVDTIKNQIVSIDSLKLLFHRMLNSDVRYNKNTDVLLKACDYYPIWKNNKGYYCVPRLEPLVYSLEFFSTDYNTDSAQHHKQQIIPDWQPYYVINTHSEIVPISFFEKKYKNKFGSNLIPYPRWKKVYKALFLIRESDTVFQNQKAYRFWTLGTSEIDRDDLKRGIERFTYVPEYGIISGVYTAYFFIPFLDLKWEGEYCWNPVKQHVWYDYLHNIQSTPLRIEMNGKVVYEKKSKERRKLK